MDQNPSSDDQPTIDVANADLLLSTTRSVRKRLDFERPVERETLLECLELAVQAPTASNRQLWRWMIVTDPELKRKIADIYRELAGLVADGTLSAPIEATYALADYREAIAHAARSDRNGKVLFALGASRD